jgi:hypothetical protein
LIGPKSDQPFSGRPYDVLRRIPIWAWLIAVIGVEIVAIGARSSGYAQAACLEVGVLLAFLLPLFALEHVIEERIADKAAIAAADAVADSVDATVSAETVEGNVAVGSPRISTNGPPTRLEDVHRALQEAGWQRTAHSPRHEVWRNGEERLTIPLEATPGAQRFWDRALDALGTPAGRAATAGAGASVGAIAGLLTWLRLNRGRRR